ncbi:hypothetical protein D3C85_249810 [compost metagenome]
MAQPCLLGFHYLSGEANWLGHQGQHSWWRGESELWLLLDVLVRLEPEQSLGHQQGRSSERCQDASPRHCDAGWWHSSGLVKLVTGDLVAVAVNLHYDITPPLHSFDDCRGVPSVAPHSESARVAELLAQLKIVDQPLCVDGVALGFRLSGSHWHSAPSSGAFAPCGLLAICRSISALGRLLVGCRNAQPGSH